MYHVRTPISCNDNPYHLLENDQFGLNANCQCADVSVVESADTVTDV